jgi:hypothetical protein
MSEGEPPGVPFLATALDTLAQPTRDARGDYVKLLELVKGQRDAAYAEKTAAETELNSLVQSPAMLWVFQAVPLVFANWALPQAVESGNVEGAQQAAWPEFVAITGLNKLLGSDNLNALQSQAQGLLGTFFEQAQGNAKDLIGRTASFESEEQKKLLLPLMAGTLRPALPTAALDALLSRAAKESGEGGAAEAGGASGLPAETGEAVEVAETSGLPAETGEAVEVAETSGFPAALAEAAQAEQAAAADGFATRPGATGNRGRRAARATGRRRG